ncbi:SDR family NAD(P)-dependent oxidoreductase [Rhodococcus wratislaviensis]|uniref:SDR family NAD(P)-dependent oxidoreductase n=1 Tax=Rhodococcus wratislaviensis TaxID=44752 RepID=UPI003659F536
MWIDQESIISPHSFLTSISPQTKEGLYMSAPSTNSPVVIVTGGSKGIGLAIAQRFLDDGARVTIVGRGQDALDVAVAQLDSSRGEILAVSADVGNEDDRSRIVDATVERFGGLDVLINNAGIAEEGAITETTVADWHRVLEVNLTAPFSLTQKAARVMKGGAIVNITSIDAYGVDGPLASYGSSKAGLIRFTRSAAVELAPLNIRVNSVSPGLVMTEMNEKVLPPETVVKLKTEFARAPMRRSLEPGEIANAVHFLASPAASGITGSELVVDAGLLANLYVWETVE